MPRPGRPAVKRSVVLLVTLRAPWSDAGTTGVVCAAVGAPGNPDRPPGKQASRPDRVAAAMGVALADGLRQKLLQLIRQRVLQIDDGRS